MASTIVQKFKNVGPGALVAAGFIGPGTVTTCTVSGANYGYTMLWALLFATVATIIFQEMSARVGIVTQEGLGENIRDRVSHPVLKWIAIVIVIIAIFVGNVAYETGNITGGILGIQAVLPNVGMLPLIVVVGALAFAAMWIGSYKVVELVLTAIVIFMGVVFLVTAFASSPDWGAVVGGLFVPTVPEAGSQGILTAVGLVGTTIVPYNLFLHASGAAERFKDPERISDARFDTVLSIGLGGLISMAVLVCAAANIHGTGVTVTNGKDMAMALEPLMGSWATWLIGLGLLAAGFSSAVTAPLSAAYAVNGVLGWKLTLKDLRFKAVWAIVLVAGCAMAVGLGKSPTELILVAQGRTPSCCRSWPSSSCIAPTAAFSGSGATMRSRTYAGLCSSSSRCSCAGGTCRASSRRCSRSSGRKRLPGRRRMNAGEGRATCRRGASAKRWLAKAGQKARPFSLCLICADGLDVDAGFRERRSNGADELECMRVVAVHADGVGLHGDGFPGGAFDRTFRDRADRAAHGETFVGYRGVRLRARDKQPFIGVIAVGEELAGAAQSDLFAGAHELAVRESDEHERRVRIAHGAGDGSGERRVDGGSVVHLPVRFHVREPHVARAAKRLQRPHLIQHERVCVVGGERHVASAETLQVGVAGVRPDGHARPCGGVDGAAHDARVAGVHAAGDVHAGYERDHLRVEPERVAPEAFAKVGVEVDAVHGNPFERG